MLCNKKVPDRERKMCLVLQVSFEKERSSRYGDSVLKEKKIDWNQCKCRGTEKITWDREKFEIKGVRDTESLLYMKVDCE